ncbi:MAG: crotonobetaine/carnitine-CoA ligase [Verrucomicrobiales bacterium]|jgi:crotonobetaine/carnitine-CoA ligase
MTGCADPTTFAHVWANAASTRPDAPFLTFEAPDGTVTDWTYGEFDRVVARAATELSSHGVGPGAAVHLALTNSPTFVAVWIATIRLGGWIVPSDPMGRSAELADHIERTGPVAGFFAEDRATVYRAAATDIALFPIDEADVDFEWLPTQEFTHWPEPGLRDAAAVMFTSGTTGRPKGVVVSQANYAFAGQTMAEAAGLTSEDRYLVVLPMFHANAQYYSFAAAVWAGASVALMHTFSASGFLPQAQRHAATCASLFAAPLRMILARGGPVEGLRLRHCWFAQNIADDQHRVITEWFGCAPRQLYGMTETIPAVLTDEAALPRADSMGFVTAGCDVEIHDVEGVRVGVDEVGEIVVRATPGLTLFTEYLADPETTADSFDGEWFRTGDRASCDSTGRFFFEGRRSDVLKVAGENVSTVEVEAVLTAHPAVLEASVIGVPDQVRDEVPVAFVVAAEPDSPPSVADLHEWCQSRLGKAKRPREITLLDELPRTSVGKIRKFMLKDEVLQT